MAILDPESEHKPDATQQWRAPGPDESSPGPGQPETKPAARSSRSRWRLVVTPFAKVVGAISRFLDFTIFSSLTRRAPLLRCVGLVLGLRVENGHCCAYCSLKR